jgi:hypothetical protein
MYDGRNKVLEVGNGRCEVGFITFAMRFEGEEGEGKEVMKSGEESREWGFLGGRLRCRCKPNT